ncbi:hypothetical protein PBI_IRISHSHERPFALK_92 [Mycobacterium phage IrishSherpFalk]|nr:hypothetical protein PBI_IRISHSHERPFALK_92 [Mycobacterium phage IrishSherpFalk]
MSVYALKQPRPGGGGSVVQSEPNEARRPEK